MDKTQQEESNLESILFYFIFVNDGYDPRGQKTDHTKDRGENYWGQSLSREKGFARMLKWKD